jgi:hypothetical protein
MRPSRLCRTAKAYTDFLKVLIAREFIEDFGNLTFRQAAIGRSVTPSTIRND